MSHERHTSSHSKTKSFEKNQGSQSPDEEDRKNNEKKTQKSKSNKKSVLKGYYVVEKILDKRKDQDGWKYKIKWMGYPTTECTWEPISNLFASSHSVESGVPLMIKEFEKTYEKIKMNKNETDKKQSKLSSVSHRVEEDSLSSRNKSEKSQERRNMEDRSESPEKKHRENSFEEKHKIPSNIKNKKKETQTLQNSKIPAASDKNIKFMNIKKHHSRDSEDKNDGGQSVRTFKEENEKRISRNFKGEKDKISSKGSRIMTKNKELLQSNQRKVSSSFSASSHKSERISKNENNFNNKRKREEENRLSSQESNNRYKKKLILESESESSKKSHLIQTYKPKSIPNKQIKKKVIPIEKQPKIQKNIKTDDSSKYKYINIINKPIPGVIPKEKGNFIYGDKAKAIISAKLEDDEILCQIEWLPRYDGTLPQNSYFSNTFIKEYDPLLLVNYYETKIKLSDQKNVRIKTSSKAKKKEGEIIKENEGTQKNDQYENDMRSLENQVFDQKSTQLHLNNINSEKSHREEKEFDDISDKINEKLSLPKLIDEAMEIEKKFDEEKNVDKFLALPQNDNNKIYEEMHFVQDNSNNLSKKIQEPEQNESQAKIKLDLILAEFTKPTF